MIAPLRFGVVVGERDAGAVSDTQRHAAHRRPSFNLEPAATV